MTGSERKCYYPVASMLNSFTMTSLRYVSRASEHSLAPLCRWTRLALRHIGRSPMLATILLLFLNGILHASDSPHRYAVLVLATDETNPTRSRKPDAEKANVMEITLARVYGALSLENCTYLLPRELEAAVNRLPSRSNYLLFDCCYSGSILDKLTLDNALMFSTTGSTTRGMLAADFSNCAAFLENLADSSCELDVNDTMDCQKAFSATLAAAQKYNVHGDRQPDDNPGEEHGAQPSGKIPKMKIGDLFMPASFHRPTIAKEVNQKGRSRGSPASKPAATPTGPALGGKSIQ